MNVDKTLQSAKQVIIGTESENYIDIDSTEVRVVSNVKLNIIEFSAVLYHFALKSLDGASTKKILKGILLFGPEHRHAKMLQVNKFNMDFIDLILIHFVDKVNTEDIDLLCTHR